MLSDSPVNKYKNKFMFHIVYRHLNYLFPGSTFFYGIIQNQAMAKVYLVDGVGDTLKRTADKAVAEGQDIVNLSSLKYILLARCSSLKLPLLILT